MKPRKIKNAAEAFHHSSKCKLPDDASKSPPPRRGCTNEGELFPNRSDGKNGVVLLAERHLIGERATFFGVRRYSDDLFTTAPMARATSRDLLLLGFRLCCLDETRRSVVLACHGFAKKQPASQAELRALFRRGTSGSSGQVTLRRRPPPPYTSPTYTPSLPVDTRSKGQRIYNLRSAPMMDGSAGFVADDGLQPHGSRIKSLEIKEWSVRHKSLRGRYASCWTIVIQWTTRGGSAKPIATAFIKREFTSKIGFARLSGEGSTIRR